MIGIYIDDRAPDRPADFTRFDGRMQRLLAFWGSRPLSDISKRACREYVDHREGKRRDAPGGRPGGNGGARRDLEDLRAAVSHHAAKGLHRGHVEVWLPDRGAPRERWLTRSEAAALLRACWRARERQKAKHDRLPSEDKNPTSKRTLRHIARFILLGLYTGTRAGAIASASFYAASGRSYADLDRGVFFRLAEGRKATSKRQPPVPLPPRLLAHMRRWKRLAEADARSQGFVVEYRGKPIQSVKVGFARAVEIAELEGPITPHTLRHTAATWLRIAGVSQFEAAGYLGMSVAMLNRVYAHQDERNLVGAALAIGSKPAANYSPTNARTKGESRKNIAV